jgi:hypothetical protein
MLDEFFGKALENGNVMDIATSCIPSLGYSLRR